MIPATTMTATPLESLLENILGNSKTFASSVPTGSCAPGTQKKGIAELLEELLSTRFSGRQSWAKNWSAPEDELKQILQRLLSTQSTDKTALLEILLPLLTKSTGSFSSNGWSNERELLLSFLLKFLIAHPQGRTSSPSLFGIHGVTPATFPAVSSMSVSEIKSYVRIWIRQLTLEILLVESPVAFREATVDRVLVKKIVGKFVEIVDTYADEKVRHVLIDALRNLDVFAVIENTFEEVKVTAKFNLVSLEDLVWSFKSNMREGFQPFRNNFGESRFGPFRSYETGFMPHRHYETGYGRPMMASGFGEQSGLVLDLIKMML